MPRVRWSLAVRLDEQGLALRTKYRALLRDWLYVSRVAPCAVAQSRRIDGGLGRAG